MAAGSSARRVSFAAAMEGVSGPAAGGAGSAAGAAGAAGPADKQAIPGSPPKPQPWRLDLDQDRNGFDYEVYLADPARRYSPCAIGEEPEGSPRWGRRGNYYGELSPHPSEDERPDGCSETEDPGDDWEELGGAEDADATPDGGQISGGAWPAPPPPHDLPTSSRTREEMAPLRK